MGKVLTMRTSLVDEKTGQRTQYKIVNCPVMVESQKFNRFQFKFNFGFILKRDYDKNGEVEYIQMFHLNYSRRRAVLKVLPIKPFRATSEKTGRRYEVRFRS